MSTVFRFNGLRVVIYPNGHRPAHVHVKGANGEAAFILHCSDRPPELRGSYGFKLSELNAIETAISGQLASLCAEWSNHHDNY